MYPILYSFRRCPYAIRARLVLKYCGIQVELREVVLADKSALMLSQSSKGTVPVLILDEGDVLDESIDIIFWALSKNDPDQWMVNDSVSSESKLFPLIHPLVEINDGVFKEHLDHYKYADRFPEFSREYYRSLAEEFLQKLESLLEKNQFLLGNQITYIDIAIFPFIRQFAFVDKAWFDGSGYTQLQIWLDSFLQLPLFTEVMEKYPQWSQGDNQTIF